MQLRLSNARPLCRPSAFLLMILAVIAWGDGSNLGAADSPVENAAARIDSVTIFTDRATVRRVQNVTLSGTQKILRFTDLPQAAAADSIRASAKGVEIASVSVRPGPADRRPGTPGSSIETPHCGS
jgi:hypothetical protein